MVRILAILFLCLPCFGQVSFTFTDQPFLQSDNSIPYATNLTYRWVSSDLTLNAYINQWSDRIYGKILQTNGVAYTNGANGIWFDRYSAGSTFSGLTNGGTVSAQPQIGPCTNFALSFILKPWIPANDIDNNGYNVWHTAANITGAGFVYASYKTGPLFGLTRPIVFTTWSGAIDLGGVVTNEFSDISFIVTNSASQTIHIYTNGQLCNVISGQSGWTSPTALLKRGNGFLYSYQGLVREIWFRTNNLFSLDQIQAHATDLHYTRTNLYGVN